MIEGLSCQALAAYAVRSRLYVAGPQSYHSSNKIEAVYKWLIHTGQTAQDHPDYSYNNDICLYDYIECMHELTKDAFLDKQKKFESKNEKLDNQLFVNIYKALISIQGNPVYTNEKENVITDAIRDQLNMIYQIRDQSRIGLSQGTHDSGEVDLCIWKNGFITTIIEVVKLSSLRKAYVRLHIQKLVKNYNPYGCREIFLLIYYSGKKCDEFWEKTVVFLTDEVGMYKTKRHEKLRWQICMLIQMVNCLS